jgi:hypothetical protein
MNFVILAMLCRSVRENHSLCSSITRFFVETCDRLNCRHCQETILRVRHIKPNGASR